MSFQGSLDTVGLEDVFQLFSFSRKSGALRLKCHDDDGAVYFHEGEVYYATTNPTEGVGKGLVNAGVVSSEDWKSVLAKTRGGELSQGKALVELKGVDAGIVEAFVRERVEDAVFKLLQWETGEFALQDEAHPLGPVFLFSCEALLSEGRKRLEIWNEIKNTIPSTSMGVGLSRDIGDEVEEIVLTRDEWRVVATLTPGLDIEDLASALGDTEYATCRILHRMLDRGVVELYSPEKLEVMRRLMSTAQSLDAGPGDEVPGFDEVHEVEEAVSEVVVDQTDEDVVFQSDADAVEHLDAHGAGVEEAQVEAASTVPHEVDLEPAVEAVGVGEEHVTPVDPTEAVDAATVEGTGQGKVSLADLAAAAEGDDAESTDPVPPEAHAHWQEVTPEAHAAVEQVGPEGGHYEYVEPVHGTTDTGQSFAELAAEDPPAEVDAAETGADGEDPGGSGDGGEELDKGLILRLIAGVRSL